MRDTIFCLRFFLNFKSTDGKTFKIQLHFSRIRKFVNLIFRKNNDRREGNNNCHNFFSDPSEFLSSDTKVIVIIL